MAFPLKCLGLFLSFLLLGIPSNGQVALNDDLCPRLSPVLCVRDVLLAIASTTKSLNRTLNQIDDEIEEKVQIIDTLNRYVQFELSLIHFRLPTPQFHMQFIQMNNVDQKYANQLFLEAHYAMSFYLNTINDILNLQNPYAADTDSWLRQVRVSIRHDLICRYRSILRVYAYSWPRIDDTARIEFSKRKYLDTSSLMHDVRSILTVRLVREWMRRIHAVMINLESKLT